ncbi:hypothetical protein LTS18_004949 [Coniosporium uncinatum]|uniref:Uncharacterized protein n=1 Tax=Coniosporium uncinatum TaxID=93489 RepID=A0ACC3D5I5_9PEZI|nr:hypothetical protein LTS18_004949 [Coniosporium uncinatum]
MSTKPCLSQASQEQGWYTHFNIDLIVKVLSYTILHPFVAWMIPLSLCAQLTPYSHLSLQLSVAYASLLTALFIFSLIDKRIAYGPPRDVDVSEEIIVITGGASGLGLLLAQVYGMRGASVAVLDVNRVNEESRGITFYNCDVGDKSQVEQAADAIRVDLGTPTILINNAGIVHGKPMLELAADEVERNFRVNLLSHFNTIQNFLPGMLEAGHGTIVTVASVLGHLGSANLSDYTSAKAGLIAMHRSLQAELRCSNHKSASNIKTVLCTPGQLNTPLFAGLQTPSAFLAPVVEPVDLAKEIIKLVDAGEGGEISLPFYAKWIPWLNVLPAGLQRIVRAMSGLDSAMEAMHTRKKSQ